MILFLCIVLLFICVYLAILKITGRFVKKNETVYASKECRLTCKEPLKKILYLYQPSTHGSVEQLAEFIAQRCQVEKFEVCVNRIAPELHYNLAEYDVIVLSSAVYMGLPSLVVQKYIEAHSFEGKKIVLLLLGKQTNVTEELEMLADRITDTEEICKIKIGKNEYEKAWNEIYDFILAKKSHTAMEKQDM